MTTCKNFTFPILFIQFVFLLSGCTKFVEVDSPITSITSENAFNSDATAIGVVTALYTEISQTSNYVNRGLSTISVFAGLSADELMLFPGSVDVPFMSAFRNSFTSANIGSADFWSKLYQYLYSVNVAIKGLSESDKLTPSIQRQLMGEAKFLRAFFYFYLVNIYGDVPLVLTTDYIQNTVVSRNDKDAVYLQIVKDLIDARELMGSNYVDASLVNFSEERVRPNRWTAVALLARTYLFTGKYSEAEAQSSALIENTQFYNLTSLIDVFKKNSQEAIWQLQPVDFGWNTQDAKLFVIPSVGFSAANPVYLNDDLIKCCESDDARKDNWIGQTDINGVKYYFPFKYKINAQNDIVSEYLTVFRLSEQYLIRAEARARQNKIGIAKEDLNIVRSRAGLSGVEVDTDSALISAIIRERRVELFSEWGHRWFDLKRTGGVDSVMSSAAPKKGTQWQSTDQLYPIPIREIQRNPNLKQNPGY